MAFYNVNELDIAINITSNTLNTIALTIPAFTLKTCQSYNLGEEDSVTTPSQQQAYFCIEIPHSHENETPL
ncbi:13340_t:CDS:2 [Ambispora gerdemannii]|uniref:13340_t:CDS:1 n=1 Tax=Ambispora gerdemannii TaxID=144530 RepID=A0A9N8V4X6_9GLOM|nr:13340_t:CDS:2 [Ambispora gerdemannii]